MRAKNKRLKKQNLILLNRCRKLESQRDVLLAAWIKYFDSKQTIKVSDWMEEERKRQMRKSNATS